MAKGFTVDYYKISKKKEGNHFLSKDVTIRCETLWKVDCGFDRLPFSIYDDNETMRHVFVTKGQRANNVFNKIEKENGMLDTFWTKERTKGNGWTLFGHTCMRQNVLFFFVVNNFLPRKVWILNQILTCCPEVDEKRQKTTIVWNCFLKSKNTKTMLFKTPNQQRISRVIYKAFYVYLSDRKQSGSKFWSPSFLK